MVFEYCDTSERFKKIVVYILVSSDGRPLPVLVRLGLRNFESRCHQSPYMYYHDSNDACGIGIPRADLIRTIDM